MDQELSTSAMGLLAVVAAASIFTWGHIFKRFKSPEGVLPLQPRLSVTWGGVHVLLVFMLYVFLPPLVYTFSQIDFDVPNGEQVDITEALKELPPSEVARLMAFSSLFSLLAVGVAAGFLVFAAQSKQEDFGLVDEGSEMFRDVRLGALGFLAATLPVLSVQMLVTQLVPYEHPVLDMLSHADSDRLWVVAALSAAVVAPVSEEFFFRAVLQGWLERLALRGQDGITAQVIEDEEGGRFLKLLRMPIGVKAAWPVWVSAAVFALMHVGQGAAPVPLVLLGAMLGYIYRQTHRLIPCIVLHCLFNTLSLVIFRLSITPG